MALICLVTLEADRPPGYHPDGPRRVWRDTSDAKDWDLLEAQLRRDGYTIVSNRREFVEDKALDSIKDSVELKR